MMTETMVTEEELRRLDRELVEAGAAQAVAMQKYFDALQARTNAHAAYQSQKQRGA